MALTAALAVALAGCGDSGRPPLVVGAVDDAVRSDPDGLLDELTESGFGAVAVTSIWEPGLTAPTEAESATLLSVADAASRRDVRVYVAVYPRGSATTPLTPAARAEFSSYVAQLVRSLPSVDDVIVGNEPNLNRFWLPQFGPGGEDVAAPAYLSLLAETYDAVKSEREEVRVWGGATAPRGIDRPGTGRDTHSPTTFIRDLGTAYRASGRTAPVMDGFVHHPYAESSRVPLDQPHPRTTTIGLADYDKLVGLLGAAFDETEQAGSELPILYGEIGVETSVPVRTAGPVHGRRARACHGRAGAGGGIRASTRPGGLPADCRGRPPLPRPRRAAPRGLAIGRALCGRDAEGKSRHGFQRRAERSRHRPRRTMWRVSEPSSYERIEDLPGGQYVAYTFYKVDPAWRRLPVDERAAGKDAFADVVEEWAGRIEGLARTRRRAFVRRRLLPLEDHGALRGPARAGRGAQRDPLAGWLETPYSYLATTKPLGLHGQEACAPAARVIPRNGPYLVVYPFVKKRPWYSLPSRSGSRR